MMIVVGIIGILASIAIPSFLNMRQRAKAAEASHNLGAIRSTEISYFAEYSRYIGNQPYTPDHTANPAGRVNWADGTRFSVLGYAPEGPVYFSYNLEGADEPLDGFTASAMGDLDNDGLKSYWYIHDTSRSLVHSGGMF